METTHCAVLSCLLELLDSILDLSNPLALHLEHDMRKTCIQMLEDDRIVSKWLHGRRKCDTLILFPSKSGEYRSKSLPLLCSKDHRDNQHEYLQHK